MGDVEQTIDSRIGGETFHDRTLRNCKVFYWFIYSKITIGWVSLRLGWVFLRKVVESVEYYL